MQTIPPSGGVRPIIFGRSSVVVHFAQKTNPPLVIPKPALSARNPLLPAAKQQISRATMPRFGTTNPLGFLHSIDEFVTTVSSGWRRGASGVTNGNTPTRRRERQTLVTPHNRPASATPIIISGSAHRQFEPGFLPGKNVPPANTVSTASTRSRAASPLATAPRIPSI